MKKRLITEASRRAWRKAGKKAGKMTTPAMTAARRANGAKGGRPRKHPKGTTPLMMEHLRRINTYGGGVARTPAEKRTLVEIARLRLAEAEGDQQ